MCVCVSFFNPNHIWRIQYSLSLSCSGRGLLGQDRKAQRKRLSLIKTLDPKTYSTQAQGGMGAHVTQCQGVFHKSC